MTLLIKLILPKTLKHPNIKSGQNFLENFALLRKLRKRSEFASQKVSQHSLRFRFALWPEKKFRFRSRYFVNNKFTNPGLLKVANSCQVVLPLLLIVEKSHMTTHFPASELSFKCGFYFTEELREHVLKSSSHHSITYFDKLHLILKAFSQVVF